MAHHGDGAKESNNHTVRSERWRYIRYADGSQELYDHAADPHEGHNLAGDRQYAGVIAAHARWFPQVNAPEWTHPQPAPSASAR